MRIDFKELEKDEQALVIYSLYTMLNDDYVKDGQDLRIAGRLLFDQKIDYLQRILIAEGYPDPEQLEYHPATGIPQLKDNPIKIGNLTQGDVNQFYNKFRFNFDELESFDMISLGGFSDPLNLDPENYIKQAMNESQKVANQMAKRNIISDLASKALSGLISNPNNHVFEMNIEKNVQVSIQYAKELYNQLEMDKTIDPKDIKD